jgi:Xaa-Pro aminopeptidase
VVEVWKDIKGRVIKGVISSNGYLLIRLSLMGVVKAITNHKIIAETFIRPLKNKEVINHINGNKIDNRLINLEITNQKDNCRKASKLGLIKNGIKHHKSILTKKEVVAMRELREITGLSYQKIANKFKVDRKTAERAIKRETYREVEK